MTMRLLVLRSLGKNFSRRQFETFSLFFRKQMTFYENCLHWANSFFQYGVFIIHLFHIEQHKNWQLSLSLVMLNKLRCHTHFKFSASHITWSRIVDTNSHAYIMTNSADPDQLASWLFQKPTDLDLLCLHRQGISGFSRIMVNICLQHFTTKPLYNL